MRLFTDHIGYPWIELDHRLAVSLLPITKYQFEAFLSEPGGLSNSWYEQLIAINPRCSWRNFEDARREQLFMTGVFPQEALQFAKWLGEEYDLPTAGEWRHIDEALRKLKGTAPTVETFLREALSHAAERLITRLVRVSRIQSWHGLTLMRRGIMEWVHVGEKFGCHGVTRPNFWPMTHNPRVDPPQLPLKSNRRNKQCGFRLVRRIGRKPEES
jgi:hypothetical protein